MPDEPNAYATFLSYSDAEQKRCIEWIYAAKTEDTKVERIAKLLNDLVREQRLTDESKQ